MANTQQKDSTCQNKVSKDRSETKRRRKKKIKNPIPYSMRENPELNHPSLTRGQKKFLGSICTVYSTENMKRSIEEQYVRQLIYEKDKGIIKDADWFKYLDYFCQPSKRKHLFQPPTPLSRSVKTRKPKSSTINRPILTPLPPIPRAVTENIRNTKRPTLSSPKSRRNQRYVTTIRRNESIPDVSFDDKPIEANVTVIDDDDDGGSAKTTTLTKESSELPETISTFKTEDSNNTTNEQDEIETDTSSDVKNDSPSAVNETKPVSESQTNDDSAETECEGNETPENTNKEENAEQVAPKTSEDAPSLDQNSSEILESKEEEVDKVDDEKKSNDTESVKSETTENGKASTSSSIDFDKVEEQSSIEEKESASIISDNSTTIEEETSPLGEPTTNLLTLLGQPDDEVSTFQTEPITRPKSRTGNRPTRAHV